MTSNGTVLGTPHREHQEYDTNVIEYKDPGRNIPIIFLLYSWGSLFGGSQQGPFNLEKGSLGYLQCSLSMPRAVQDSYLEGQGDLAQGLIMEKKMEATLSYRV